MTRSKQTELIHDTQRGVAYQCANQPLYYASTYHQQRLGEAVPYDYARSGNPNRELLETKLAQLEGGKRAFAFNSGIAAITAVFLTLSQATTSFYRMMCMVGRFDLQSKFYRALA